MSQKQIKRLRKEEKEKVRQAKLVDGVKNVSSIRKILKDNWAFLTGVCLVVFILYINSLAGDFVSDDYASIPQNPMLGNFSYMSRNTPWFLNYLTFKLFGFGSSVPYHVLNVFIYLGVIVVAFVLLEMLFKDNLLSKVVLVIFAVLPLHVETVAWISGRIYMILAIYIMLAFMFFIKIVETGRWSYGIGTAVMFLLAFMTDKPRPFSLVLLFFLYLYYRGRVKIKIDLWKMLLLGVAVLIFFLYALPMVKDRVTSVNSGYNATDSIFYNPFFQYPTGIAKYLQLMWVPIDLTLYHTLYVVPAWLNWLTVLTLLAIIVWGWFKDKRYFFALMFFLLTLAPSMAPLKVSWLVAERYAFLPSLGFTMFLGLLITDWWKQRKKLMQVFLVCLLLFYSARVFLRNIDWQTNHNLWVRTVQMSPNSHNAWNNIGDDYDKLGDSENAVKGFTQSTVMKPNYADAYHNRANILFKMGRWDLARGSYDIALSFAPTMYQTTLSLSHIDVLEEKWELAIRRGERLVELMPNSHESHFVFGVILARAGWRDRAIEEMRLVLRLNPGFKQAQQAIDELTAIEE